ncbi:aldehyde dehydrogenase family protein [Aquabacterium sp. J223]|uniref:aldehyde dehydrogenase family protein n=1 Tax=Aquabacterium sp. J223 TaxID=2898431 RepID=UPI0021AE2137|nr:aldehyde dehydrogenase family protein [Aquabacterium sp. J223]UUX95451.1 aldehyde dehydrogenase family protein [Aquabacterium sp. J223]
MTTPESVLPRQRDLYYGGGWHRPHGGHAETINPATGESLGRCADADATDVDAAVQAARAGFETWRRTKPLERARLMREVGAVLRRHADELAMIDALNCGNPVKEMRSDAVVAAAAFDYCAGLVTEVKGETIPMGEGVLNLSLREPYGVVGRIVAYNHPLMFVAGKIAPAIAVGNSVIMKPPHQAPLSAYRFMELIDGLLPPGVVNVLSCGRAGSEALVHHPDVPRLSLIGSVPTGRAIARAAAERLKHVTLELGGKNACVIYPDADLEKAAKAAVDGMNFTWCGQSCGSTSRLFVHEAVYDQVLARVLERVKHYRPGLPTEPDTTMGAIVSREQLDKILGYIEIAKNEGATLAWGGKRPDDPRLARGFFVEPTIFTDVTPQMRIANEEVFGPVLSVLRWHDEDALWDAVNRVEYGLTGSIWTTSLAAAHRASARMQAGFVWVNHVSSHFLGASFGGVKQSGIGREEGLDELYSFTQGKNVHIVL